jgi:D-alanyl-D-alanine carboxypeptidase (penicillin-binding protein 5/6)
VRQRLNLKKAVLVPVTVMLMLVLILTPPLDASWKQAEAQTRSPSRAIPDPPELEAEAWALMDAESGLYLAGENADEQLPIASTTKIMSALVILEDGVDLDDEVEVTSEAEEYVGGTYSNVGLIAGERLTARDLLTAALVPSGTEAIYVLAQRFGAGSVDNFVERMNEKADEMGLENTNFETPAGLDTPDNYSSARDLAKIAQEALKYPVFAELVDTTDTTISTQNRSIEISNTNLLLTTYRKATGVKTGTSPESGANLVSSAQDGDESYIAVVLGTEDVARFTESQALLEYGIARYDRQALVEEGEVYEETPLPYRRGETVELVAEDDVGAAVDPNSEVERRTTDEELPPSAEAGERLSEVEVYVDGKSVGRSALLAREGYEEASWLDMAWYGVGWVFYTAWNAIAGLLE